MPAVASSIDAGFVACMPIVFARCGTSLLATCETRSPVFTTSLLSVALSACLVRASAGAPSNIMTGAVLAKAALRDGICCANDTRPTLRGASCSFRACTSAALRFDRLCCGSTDIADVACHSGLA